MTAEQSAEAKVLEAAGTLAKREQNSRARQASVEAQVLEILSKRDLVTALGSLGSSVGGRGGGRVGSSSSSSKAERGGGDGSRMDGGGGGGGDCSASHGGSMLSARRSEELGTVVQQIVMDTSVRHMLCAHVLCVTCSVHPLFVPLPVPLPNPITFLPVTHEHEHTHTHTHTHTLTHTRTRTYTRHTTNLYTRARTQNTLTCAHVYTYAMCVPMWLVPLYRMCTPHCDLRGVIRSARLSNLRRCGPHSSRWLQL